MHRQKHPRNNCHFYYTSPPPPSSISSSMSSPAQTKKALSSSSVVPTQTATPAAAALLSLVLYKYLLTVTPFLLCIFCCLFCAVARLVFVVSLASLLFVVCVCVCGLFLPFFAVRTFVCKASIYLSVLFLLLYFVSVSLKYQYYQ